MLRPPGKEEAVAVAEEGGSLFLQGPVMQLINDGLKK